MLDSVHTHFGPGWIHTHKGFDGFAKSGKTATTIKNEKITAEVLERKNYTQCDVKKHRTQTQVISIQKH